MSNWKPIPEPNFKRSLSETFQRHEETGVFSFPALKPDGSKLILASDYAGEHKESEFQVLAFLVTQESALMGGWEEARVELRRKHLADGRRMAFKGLTDVKKIRALADFIDAAS